MKKILLFLVLLSSLAISQEKVNLFPDRILHRISPLIYGSNQTLIPEVTTAMRLGGNRMTGYNWVNNYSNAGEDWYHSSDNYLPWIMNIPENEYEKTGIVLTEFHSRNIRDNCYSLVTLPLAGYAAKDKNGEVSEAETAPSSRWAKVINRKGSEFDLHPSLLSDTIYIDECINFLNNYFKQQKQIDAYSLDNEPALWAYTHPRIHPERVTVKELVEKSAGLAAVIKEMSSESEVFGPALYGFGAFLNLQDASDWAEFSSSYKTFIDAYLDLMRQKSTIAGIRLLDVLDVHWYPEPEGVYSGDTSKTASIRRMESIRTLWDSTYTEDSWIGEWFSPVALLKSLKASVSQYYDGTKIGITEYDYNGNEHISGGIAQALLLGVLGKENIYFASKWGEISEFNRLAFEIYRNYDGDYSKFGDLCIENDADNRTGLSVFSSIDAQDSVSIHLIVNNSDYEQNKELELVINSEDMYLKYDIYSIYRNSKNIEIISKDKQLVNNNIKDIFPPLSISHLVIKTDKESKIVEKEEVVLLNPNPASDYIEIKMEGKSISSKDAKLQEIKIFNTLGECVITETIHPMTSSYRINIESISSGIYYLKIGNYTGKFVVVK